MRCFLKSRRYYNQDPILYAIRSISWMRASSRNSCTNHPQIKVSGRYRVWCLGNPANSDPNRHRMSPNRKPTCYEFGSFAVSSEKLIFCRPFRGRTISLHSGCQPALGNRREAKRPNVPQITGCTASQLCPSECRAHGERN